MVATSEARMSTKTRISMLLPDRLAADASSLIPRDMQAVQVRTIYISAHSSHELVSARRAAMRMRSRFATPTLSRP